MAWHPTVDAVSRGGAARVGGAQTRGGACAAGCVYFVVLLYLDEAACPGVRGVVSVWLWWECMETRPVRRVMSDL